MSGVWKAYPALASARVWSRQRVGLIRQHLTDLEKEVPALRSVILSGSLARLDACPQSDTDLIVILADDSSLDRGEAKDAARRVWERLAPLGLRQPQSQGVFVTPTSRRQLCDGPCGIVDEAVDIFGKRMQLVLEARAVLGDDACKQLQRDILLRYRTHPFAERTGEKWSYLTDDLIRYWRSYRVWRHWDVTPTNGGWFLRNLKLRHSRLLTYASLLLGCLTDTSDRPADESLLKLLALTPLERIRQIDQQVEAKAFDLVCRHYDNFLRVVNDAAHRQALEQASLPSAQATEDCPREFADLLDNADGLLAALWCLLRHLPDRLVSRLAF